MMRTLLRSLFLPLLLLAIARTQSPCVITNLAPQTRKTWVVVAVNKVPATEPTEATFVSVIGHRFRAVKDHDRGLVSTIYRVHAILEGLQTLSGEIRPERHPDAGTFVPHPWVTDNVDALLPRVRIDPRGTLQPTGAQLIESSPAHQRWRVTGQRRGFVLRWYADILHQDPVVQCWGLLKWTDRSDPALDLFVDGIAIETGELFSMDFAKRNGCTQPTRLGNKWVTGLSGPLGFIDGSALPIVGRMTSYTGPVDVLTPSLQGEGALDLSSLYAATYAPALGMGTGFDGNWLGALRTPRFRSDMSATSNGAFNRFTAELEQTVGWYATRHYGLLPAPSSTGNQPDFGATGGGWAIAMGDPRHLWEQSYCAYADAFRGYCHHEADAQILRAVDHPNCTTWSGYPHPQQGSDLLNKAAPIWGSRRSTGWTAYDDEHLSTNNLAAVAALSDDPIIDELVEHLVEIQLMSHRYRNPQATDASRAQGRRAGCWATLGSVYEGTPIGVKIHALLAGTRDLSERVLAQQPRELPMRVLSHLGPFGTKPIRDPVTNELLPTTCMWELGLAVVGLRQAQLRGEPIDDTLQAACTTLARYGVVQEVSDWPLVADVAYFAGADHPVPLSRTSPYVLWAAGSGVGGWVLPGLMVAADVLPDSDLRTKVRAAVHFHTGGQEAGDLQSAQWWAISARR